MTPDELCERILNFSARIDKVVDAIPETRMGRHVTAKGIPPKRNEPAKPDASPKRNEPPKPDARDNNA
jgi:hypothetical protein